MHHGLFNPRIRALFRFQLIILVALFFITQAYAFPVQPGASRIGLVSVSNGVGDQNRELGPSLTSSAAELKGSDLFKEKSSLLGPLDQILKATKRVALETFFIIGGGEISPLGSVPNPAEREMSLFQWMSDHVSKQNRDSLVASIERYNRLQHFGGWIVHQSSRPCIDTRAEVLVRDSSDPSTIQWTPQSPCRVQSGDWHEPYTDQDFKMANALQIDHVVPLRETYYSGAWNWQASLRCHYANFLGNNYHLLAVSGHENMSKSDKSPAGYMPPAQSFQCRYLNLWMRIKTLWNLETSPDEVAAIRNDLIQNRCDVSYDRMSESDYTKERYWITHIEPNCSGFGQMVPSPPVAK